MLKAYLPVLVFIGLGLTIGVIFTSLNHVLGPRRPSKVKVDPYECGLPSEVTKNFRFGISFYQVGMLFILFDLEVVLLYPVAVVLGDSVFALVAIGIFIFVLAVAFVFEWNRGTLDWSDTERRR